MNLNKNEKKILTCKHFQGTGKERAQDIDRRKFLKYGLAGLGLLVGGGSYLSSGKKDGKVANVAPEVICEKEKVTIVAEEKPAVPELTEESELIDEFPENEEDAEISLTEMFDYNKPEIEFNLKTADRIKKYWKARYRNDPRLSKSLKDAYREMGAWLPHIQEIFRQESVPEEFAFLAIPESHWQLKAKSGAKAVGPYQFMAKTAKTFGLVVNEEIDERQDPLKSARACAKLLKYLHDISNDWKLCLSGYNGSYIWKYKTKIKESNGAMNYEGFLAYIEQQLKEIKQAVREGSVHVVSSGETLSKIAANYKTDVSTLKKINSHLKDPNALQVKDKIVLPDSEKDKAEIFRCKIKGFIENLNYPAKYLAVHELICDRFVTEQKKPLAFKTIIVGSTDERQGAGTADDIKKKSKAVKLKTITIARLSKELGVSQERLLELNPCFSEKTPIPPGYELRV